VHKNDPQKIGELLKTAKTIAVVGLTDSAMRPSFGVSEYMQAHGYKIIPVNPNIQEWLGHKAYASLLDVPEKVDIVDIFRPFLKLWSRQFRSKRRLYGCRKASYTRKRPNGRKAQVCWS
jgi:predicted CoA-binding protein